MTALRAVAAVICAVFTLMSNPVDLLTRLAPEQKSQLNRLARIELARRAAKEKDILAWGKALFPNKFPLPFCDMHRYFVEIRHKNFTSVEAPRGHAKTTIRCFLIPIFQALEEPDTFKHYLNVQATDEKSLAVNRSIKTEFEENRELIALYGDQRSERWTDAQFAIKRGPVFTARSAGQSIRGIHWKNLRPDWIAVDDLYNTEDDANNPDSTQKKNDWFWGTLYNSRAKGQYTVVGVQGTAVNKYDLMELLKQDKTCESRSFKAIPNMAARTILWPELNSYESLMIDQERMGSLIFSREFQNERRDETTCIVKQSWLDGWEFDPATLRFDQTEKIIAVKLGVDPSIGESHESDATGVALVYKTKAADGPGNRFYIMGLWNERISLNERILLLDRIRQAQPSGRQITQAPIEAIAGFKDFCAEVKRRTNLPVREIAMVKDKISVLESRSHYFENHKVKINKNISKNLRDMLLYQLTTNYPKHDDLRDAVLLTLEEDTGWGWVG